MAVIADMVKCRKRRKATRERGLSDICTSAKFQRWSIAT
jgi:hypothetical protein